MRYMQNTMARALYRRDRNLKFHLCDAIESIASIEELLD